MKLKFKNNYTASIIKGYGAEENLWEVAVLHNNKVVYDTPITDDVLGYLSDEEVVKAVTDIMNLPYRPITTTI